MKSKVFVAILGSMLLFGLALFITLWFKVTYEWLIALDEILNTSVFATLAGLSLAAAAFLMSVDESQKERKLQAKYKKKDIWNNHLNQDEISAITEWEKKNQPLLGDKTEQINNLNKYQARYVLANVEVNNCAEQISNIRSGREGLIYSFFAFVFGVVVTLTLDLVSNSKSLLSQCDEPTAFQNIYSMILTTNKGMVVFLDVTFSVIAIIVGIWLLCVGATKLLKYGKA